MSLTKRERRGAGVLATFAFVGVVVAIGLGLVPKWFLSNDSRPAAMWLAVILGVVYHVHNWLRESAKREEEREERERLQPALSVYLAEAYIRRLRGGASRLYVFRLVVSNRSDAQNSLREMRLVIEHARDGDHPASNIAVPHNATLADHLTESGVEPFRLPCLIGQRASLGGVALFEVRNDLLTDARVTAYTVVLTDTYGNESSVEALILQVRAP